MFRLTLRVALILPTLLLFGCAVTAPPRSLTAAESSTGPVTQEEAKQIALHIAHERGYANCRVAVIDREHHGWEVELEGLALGSRIGIGMWIDSRDGRILKVWEDD